MRALLLHPAHKRYDALGHACGGINRCAAHHPGGDWDILVRWGVTDGTDALFTLNATWALANTYDTRVCRQLLMSNGIPNRTVPASLRDSTAGWAVMYRVHCVDLYAIRISRLIAGVERSMPSSPERRTALESLARRALFALGLHFGAVDVGVNHHGRPYVTRIDPAPDVGESLLTTYGSALATSIQSLISDSTTDPKERSTRLLLGADPEFILQRRHNGALRYASDLFPSSGSVGYDRQSVLVRGERKHPIAEIRPEPSTSPYALVENVRAELSRARRLAPDLNTKWLAGAHPHAGYSTGGHIHFSGVRPSTFLLRALDNYLAVPTLLLEDVVRASKRRPRYGWLGEFRDKAHGGFEYRTLSSWLSGMQRARATLCLAKLVAVEYPRLTRHLLRTSADHRAFYQGDKNTWRGAIDMLWTDMQTTYSYQEWCQDLERTRIWIHKRRRWRECTDLKRLWHIH